ncbi:MAG: hypothetical protein ACPKOI_06540 [Pleomorphochaeta sp.]
MFNKKFFLPLILLFTINISLFASFGFDVGLNYTSTEIDDSGTEVDSEYPFSFVALPSFSIGKLSMELNAPLHFKLDTNFITFDYSNYQLPTPQNDLAKDALTYSKYFLGFINYIQWGTFNEDFAIRVGKITNSTIGDGALLNHYKDNNVGKFSTRAGAQLKLDTNFPIGIEFVTTDMFNPDLLGGRVNVKPLFFSNNQFLNRLAVGYTVVYNTEFDDASNYWIDLAYDLQLPIFKNADNSLITYYDLISKEIKDTDTTSHRILSQRIGFYGWLFTNFSYDAHIENLIDDNAANYDFEQNNLDLIQRAILPQFKPDFIVSGNAGFYANNGLSEFVLASELEFSDVQLDAYNLNLTIKSQKAIGPISDISIYAQKDFYKESGVFSEKFIEGFTSLKNISVDLSANIIFYQINEITVNFGLVGDSEGNIEPTYSLGYRFSLF